MMRRTRSTLFGCLLGTLLTLALVRYGHTKQWTCAGGDSACLIAAMTAANTSPEPYWKNVIWLWPGIYTFTMPHPSAPTGDTALPLVTGGVTIRGWDAEQTQLTRSTALGTPLMRLIEVAPSGTLVLADVAVQGGHIGYINTSPSGGGGLRNQGTLALYRVIVRWNQGASAAGGGIWSSGVLGMIGGNVYGNRSSGGGGGLALVGGQATIRDSRVWWNVASSNGGGIFVTEDHHLTLRGSTLSHNTSPRNGAGLANGDFTIPGGDVRIASSAVTFDRGDNAVGLYNGSSGVLEVVNTTIAANIAPSTLPSAPGWAVMNENGTLLLTSSTVAGNLVDQDRPGGGILNVSGVVLLQNTLVAQHTKDCSGTIVSLGGNLIERPSGCAIDVQPEDRTGNPGLGTFVDNGTPGNGHYSLLPTSQAVGAAIADVCPQHDQLGQHRDTPCDIGAIEESRGVGAVAAR